jgi:hypothetical protein
MLFHSVEFPGRRLRTARFILDCVAGGVLVGIGIRPPEIVAILADEQFQQVAAVIVKRHLDLIPTDSHSASITHRCHIAGWTVHVASNGLQIQFLISYSGNIPNDIHNRGRDPAGIVQFIEFDVQPFAIDVSSSDRATISRI